MVEFERYLRSHLRYVLARRRMRTIKVRLLFGFIRVLFQLLMMVVVMVVVVGSVRFWVRWVVGYVGSMRFVGPGNSRWVTDGGLGLSSQPPFGTTSCIAPTECRFSWLASLLVVVR